MGAPGLGRLRTLCLLHDAAEAYLVDWPSTMKVAAGFMVDGVFYPFTKVEDRLLAAIYVALGVSSPSKEERLLVHRLDMLLRVLEARERQNKQA